MMTSFRTKLAPLRSIALCAELAELRNDIDRLTARFRLEFGNSHETSQRGEQLAAAIQRLEWALSRQQSRALAASNRG